MDAATPSKRAKTTPHKLRKAPPFANQVATPQKVPAAAAADLTWTPEKTEQRPLLRRASGKGAVALSVKEVRRAALGLRRPDKGRAEVEKVEDALESVARELGVDAGAGRSPIKRRPEVKLPQSLQVVQANDGNTVLLHLAGVWKELFNLAALSHPLCSGSDHLGRTSTVMSPYLSF